MHTGHLMERTIQGGQQQEFGHMDMLVVDTKMVRHGIMLTEQFILQIHQQT